MPNWCYADLIVTGPNDKVSELAEMRMSFQKIRPMPEDLKDDPSDDVNMPAWYQWRLDNWGVKWDHCASDEEGIPNSLLLKHNGTLEINLMTPWGLPLEILKYTSEKYDVHIKLENCVEESLEFIGTVEINDGKVVKNTLHKPSKKEIELILGES